MFVFTVEPDLKVIGDEGRQAQERKARIRLTHGSHDPHLAAGFQEQGRSCWRRPRSDVRRPEEPDVGLAESVLPSLMEPISRDQFQVLFTKARPVDEMPLVDLKGSIEAGIEDRGKREHTLGKSRLLADQSQADPNEDLGRTKIDTARWDSNLRSLGE